MRTCEIRFDPEKKKLHFTIMDDGKPGLRAAINREMLTNNQHMVAGYIQSIFDWLESASLSEQGSAEEMRMKTVFVVPDRSICLYADDGEQVAAVVLPLKVSQSPPEALIYGETVYVRTMAPKGNQPGIYTECSSYVVTVDDVS